MGFPGHSNLIFLMKINLLKRCVKKSEPINRSLFPSSDTYIKVFKLCSLNPYKPSVLFMRHRQKVQAQIRRHRMRRLIRDSTAY